MDAQPAPNPADMLRSTLDAVPDAVIVVDANGVIVTANTQVDPVFGYQPGQLEGQLIEVLVPGRLRAGHPQRRTGYPRRPMGLLQLAAVRADGTEFPAEISLAPIDVAGVRMTVATVRDLTSRRSVEQEADRLRDQLLATVTHELRTPLTSIIGYAELMADLPADEFSEQGRTMLEAIERNARRQLRLVSDLLISAVGNLGQTKLDLAPVDVSELVSEAVAEGAVEAARSGITLVGTVPEGHGPELLLDRGRIMQVLNNVIGNAVKFTPAGGQVGVSLQLLADSAVVTITDTGPGLSEEDQRRVFERLFRGANARSTESSGAGLGLAIAQGLVEAHQGAISLVSREGQGTTVTVQLPRAPAEV